METLKISEELIYKESTERERRERDQPILFGIVQEIDEKDAESDVGSQVQKYQGLFLYQK